MRNPGAVLERLFVVAALFLLSGAVFPLLHNPNGEDAVRAGVDNLTKLVLPIVYGVGLALAAAHWKQVLRVVRSARLLTVVCLMPLVSTYWSTDRNVTLHAAIWLGAASALGIYMAVRFTAEQQVRLLGWSLFASGALSVVFALAIPKLGVDPGLHQNAWRGVFIHKNTFGRSMALTVVVCLMLARTNPTVAPLLWIGALLSTVLLILAGSGTAVALACALGLLVPVIRVLRTRRIPRAVMVTAVLVLVVAPVALLAAKWESILAGLGRDVTLTGRTVIWGLVVGMIAQKPWLGYGAQAFWHGSHADYLPIWKITGWSVPHSHNGYLDLTLDVGLIGFTVFIIGYGGAVLRAIRRLRALANTRGAGLEATWPLVYLAFFFIANLTESTILRPHSVFWVLYVSALTTLSRDAYAVAVPIPEPVRPITHPELATAS